MCAASGGWEQRAAGRKLDCVCEFGSCLQEHKCPHTYLTCAASIQDAKPGSSRGAHYKTALTHSTGSPICIVYATQGYGLHYYIAKQLSVPCCTITSQSSYQCHVAALCACSGWGQCGFQAGMVFIHHPGLVSTILSGVGHCLCTLAHDTGSLPRWCYDEDQCPTNSASVLLRLRVTSQHISWAPRPVVENADTCHYQTSSYPIHYQTH